MAKKQQKHLKRIGKWAVELNIWVKLLSVKGKFMISAFWVLTLKYEAGSVTVFPHSDI